jgi:hypothetical protein
VCKALGVVKGERLFCRKVFPPFCAIEVRVDHRSGSGRKMPFATRPLDIVSFLLTPQVRGRKIPPTFPFLFWSREPERKSSRVVPTGASSTWSPSEKHRGRNVQYLPGWTVQCINPECLARGHWLRAASSGGELCSNCSAPLRNVPPPLGSRLRLRPRSLGSYRPPGRSPGRPR